jgi:hypothetical protein
LTMASRRCWSLLIGARTLSARNGRFSARDERRLQAITTRHFPTGYTILDAQGGWFDPRHRRFVREQSRQVLICAATLATVRRWARELGAALRQKELLIVEVGRAMVLRVKGRGSA